MINIGKGMVLAYLCCAVFLVSKLANASSIILKNNNQVVLHGFLDYEGGYSTKTGQDFYKSNTSAYSKNDKTSFSSRAQVRIYMMIKNEKAHLTSNLTIQSWPGSFNLWRAYIKHTLPNETYVIIGKDWSLVDERAAKTSGFMFKPLLAGFQGSKRYPQIQIGKYLGITDNFIIAAKVAFEDRLNKNGTLIGENKNQAGQILSQSGVLQLRKTLPALAVKIAANIKTPLNISPFCIFSFFEVQPVHLLYNDSWHKKYPYVFGIGAKINIKKLSFGGEYIHTKGLTGIAGLMGNNLKTFSYIYKNKTLIARKLNSLFFNLSFSATKRAILSEGFGYVKFKNSHKADYLLPFEVKNVRTYYIDAIFKTTKLTSLFIQLDHIKTKYAASENKLKNSNGNQIWMGYRYYF